MQLHAFLSLLTCRFFFSYLNFKRYRIWHINFKKFLGCEFKHLIFDILVQFVNIYKYIYINIHYVYLLLTYKKFYIYVASLIYGYSFFFSPFAFLSLNTLPTSFFFSILSILTVVPDFKGSPKIFKLKEFKNIKFFFI